MTDDQISQSQCGLNSGAGATPAKTLGKLILLSASIGRNYCVKFSTNHKKAIENENAMKAASSSEL